MAPLRTIALLALVTAPASAQIIGAPPAAPSRPVVWLSAGIGLAQMQRVLDGRSGSSWNFGTGVVYRGSVELDIGNASTIGLSFGLAHMPMRYAGFQTPTAPPPCNVDCDAHANVSSVMGTFRAGGTAGFHQVIEIGAGVARYGKFTEDSSGTRLPPEADTDLAFSLGYGFGYTFGSAELFLIQDGALVIHQRDGLPGNSNTLSQHYYTRIGFRVGSGRR